MGVSDTELFSPYATILGSLQISDTISTDPQAGVNQILQSVAGSLDILQQGVANVDPRIGITCLNLSHLATISPLLGLRPGSDSKIQYQRRDVGGGFASSGHVTLVMSKCHVIPESIQAQQDQNQAAMLQLMVFPLFDGTNDAVRVISQALAGTPAIGAMYKLGPTVIGGTYLGGLQSANVQFGLNYQTKRGGGEDFAREGAVYSRRPQINIEPLNLSVAVNTVGFSQASNITVTQYYRRIGYAPNASQHFSVSGTGSLKLGNIATQQEDDPRPGLVFTPTGTLAISTTATIPSPA